jgi:hypothetical protein
MDEFHEDDISDESLLLDDELDAEDDGEEDLAAHGFHEEEEPETDF